MTFGEFIAKRRKELGLSQKELASKILKEDGVPISPQYLNDIEHDRRYPPGGEFLEHIAKAIDVSIDALHVLAGRIPENVLKDKKIDHKRIEIAFQAFRKNLEKK